MRVILLGAPGAGKAPPGCRPQTVPPAASDLPAQVLPDPAGRQDPCPVAGPRCRLF